MNVASNTFWNCDGYLLDKRSINNYITNPLFLWLSTINTLHTQQWHSPYYFRIVGNLQFSHQHFYTHLLKW